MQSTTFSPQKHHQKSRFFLKTLCKNAELASQKKIRNAIEKLRQGQLVHHFGGDAIRELQFELIVFQLLVHSQLGDRDRQT